MAASSEDVKVRNEKEMCQLCTFIYLVYLCTMAAASNISASTRFCSTDTVFLNTLRKILVVCNKHANKSAVSLQTSMQTKSAMCQFYA